MIREVNEQRVVTIITRPQSLARELSNRAADYLNLSENIKLVFKLDLNRTKVLVIERNRVRGSPYMDYWFSSCMPHRKLIKNVWIVVGQVRDDKAALKQVLKNLFGNHARLRDLVCSYNAQPRLNRLKRFLNI